MCLVLLITILQFELHGYIMIAYGCGEMGSIITGLQMEVFRKRSDVS